MVAKRVAFPGGTRVSDQASGQPARPLEHGWEIGPNSDRHTRVAGHVPEAHMVILPIAGLLAIMATVTKGSIATWQESAVSR
jgi:hypothetical protein